MTTALHAHGSEGIVQIVLGFFAVVQTICLAIIADRSRRVRRENLRDGERRS